MYAENASCNYPWDKPHIKGGEKVVTTGNHPEENI